jgi:hypothetical protein
VPHTAERDDDRRSDPAARRGVGQRPLQFAEPREDDAGAVGELGVARIGEGIDGGPIHMHSRIGEADDNWSFTIIGRRISHSHSILLRRNIASDGWSAHRRR